MILNKVKSYAIGVLFVFLLIVAWQLKVKDRHLQFANSEKERYYYNWVSAQSESDKNLHQIYRLAELSDRLERERDSLARIVKTRPKNITKIEYRFTVLKIPGIAPLTIKPISKGVWDVVDSTKCFTWTGQVSLSGASVSVNRTGFEYHNKSTEVFYRERSKKFLFIKYGKWINKKQESSECGETSVKTFEFIK